MKEFLENNQNDVDSTKEANALTLKDIKNERGIQSISYKVTKLGVKIKELFYNKGDA